MSETPNAKPFFKGHPCGTDIRDYILKQIAMEELPAEIPFEVLLMMDVLPDYISGVGSSVFFSLPLERIKHIAFIGKKETGSNEYHIFEVLKMLNIVQSDQVKFVETSEFLLTPSSSPLLIRKCKEKLRDIKIIRKVHSTVKRLLKK